MLIGSYVLLFTVLLALDAALELGISRVVGPNELASFWMVNAPLIFLAVPLVIEPLRVVLVAGAYDAVIARLAPATASDEAPPVQGETISRT